MSVRRRSRPALLALPTGAGSDAVIYTLYVGSLEGRGGAIADQPSITLRRDVPDCTSTSPRSLRLTAVDP